MRILAAFFGVIFMFINPAMLVNVRREVTAAFTDPTNMDMFIVRAIRHTVVDWLGIDSHLEKATPIIVVISVLLHLIITSLSLYGIYSCRPAFVRPLLIDAAISTCILFGFVSLSLYLHTNKNHQRKEQHEKNAYIGAAFLIAYFVWFSITMAGFFDVRRLHADFMYWIVEERASMKRMSLPHQVSIENRSDRSSKSSKHSARSHRSERDDGSRPNSIAGSIRSKASHHSISARTRLSVPL
ncbi:unnamed protein product, partial [Mesorhabditis belari]|uniref:Uncharacterized protein n=1 Tax=Mesorhabditis belari TaxID=2138241 RepID=A0AAF3EVW5_9BILA